jgi:ammonium transporter Rh
MFALLLALSSSNGPVPPENVLPLENGTEDSVLVKTVFIWLLIFAHIVFLFYNKQYSWTAIISALLAIFPAFIFAVFIYNVGESKSFSSVILAKGSLCALSCTISLGMLIGTIKLYQYIIYGLVFAAAFFFCHWLSIGGDALIGAVDPGFGIRVHLFAVYFAAGATLVIQEKRVVNVKPTYTKKTLSVIWMASFFAYVCWPLYGSVFYAGAEQRTAAACYLMAGAASFFGTVLAEYLMAPEHKLNPYTIAQSIYVGCIGVSNSIFIVKQYGALLVGLITGLLFSLTVRKLQERITNKVGVADIMGIHCSNGISAWISIICCSIGCYTQKAKGIWTFIAGVITFGVALICGAVAGVIIFFTRRGQIVTADFQNDFVYFDLPDSEVEKQKQTVNEL